jgi:hypothetical protein
MPKGLQNMCQGDSHATSLNVIIYRIVRILGFVSYQVLIQSIEINSCTLISEADM